VKPYQEAASWHVPKSLQDRILDHLGFLYGPERAARVWPDLKDILRGFNARNPDLALSPTARELTERDAILITYGDQFREPGPHGTVRVPPLQTLRTVLTETLDHPVSSVHILPFYPYSSDDGFSIIDYSQVDPSLGSWPDVERLGDDLCLMFDAVINHISRQSEWFQRFLAGDPAYRDWFIAFDPEAPTDWVSKVVRPRTLSLLTPVQTATGEKLVWTTFSADQIDLNYAHPPLLLKIIEILLLYVERGAQIIRLDAIAYLWKEIGTPCIHLPETHRVIKLFRCVLDAVAPGVLLITETNVPHEENISYFGVLRPDTGRTDEAQLVYQFPLAPLIMHSLLSGDARIISRWAAGLDTPAPQATFFNFTASHDGIGVMPARGLLSEAQIEALIEAALAHGGRVSYTTNPDGSRSVYELNISYFDALSDPGAGEPQAVQVARVGVSQAIMLALRGVPGIYVHSLLGSRSWHEGVRLTGRNRSINREKFQRAALERELADPTSLRHQVFGAYVRLLRARASDPAFHPYGEQRALFLDDGVVALLRLSPDGASRVLCLNNVTAQRRSVWLDPGELDLEPGLWRDLLGGEAHRVEPGGLSLSLAPYAVHWLKV